MRVVNRKSTPKVVSGEVRKKNNWAQSPDYFYAPKPRMIEVDRKRPRDGYRHVLTKADIYTFLELLPDWDELAVGLHAIVLGRGSFGTDGYYFHRGIIEICAWDESLWIEYHKDHYAEHRNIFERLNVECEKAGDTYYLCKFDEASARAYQLLHILLHELGHHHDRMTTHRQRETGRGEKYAEEYALRYEPQIWRAYQKAFRF